MPFGFPDWISTASAYGVAFPNPLDVATGLLSQTSGLGYVIAAFFILIVGSLVIFKFFDILTKVVVISGISAFLPVAVNIITGYFYGTGIFQLTPQLIVGFITLGISVFFIHRMVTTGLDFLEKGLRIVSMPLRSVINRHKVKVENTEKKEFREGVKAIKKMKNK